MKKCDKRQQAVLAYMKNTIRDKGFPPTVREICDALDIKSTSTVHNDLKVLEHKGLITKAPSKPRALTLVGSEQPAPQQPSGSLTQEDFDTVSLPVIGRVAAGVPILSEENIEDTVPFPARFVGSGTNFILTVHGSSMINAGINDGDYLIVQEEREARNGDIVVAMIEGEYDSEATVKRFYREQGHIRLQPENDEMDPIIVEDCTIIGKVKGVFRYFH